MTAENSMDIIPNNNSTSNRSSSTSDTLRLSSSSSSSFSSEVSFSMCGDEAIRGDDNQSPAQVTATRQAVDRNLQARGTQRKYLRRGVRSPRMLEFHVKQALAAMHTKDGSFASPYGSHLRTSFQKKVRVKVATTPGLDQATAKL
ncbi:expressed unknown protein [Seminavis robusta]|uniref:Uncharacterized protein n=1 Tax=Seminavis robusta TaxID=568900 RepID=A0A9N8HSE9_9STRA|nr:expressed unknown protein [Seminavis robusta]|eukprot:Sro1711_g292850.1 n/a (145) ;mRNA; r:15808-16242